jgi:hypothetical protein
MKAFQSPWGLDAIQLGKLHLQKRKQTAKNKQLHTEFLSEGDYSLIPMEMIEHIPGPTRPHLVFDRSLKCKGQEDQVLKHSLENFNEAIIFANTNEKNAPSQAIQTPEATERSLKFQLIEDYFDPASSNRTSSQQSLHSSDAR